MNTYKGKRRKTLTVRISASGVTTTRYESDKTVVTTVNHDGEVEVTVEPP